MNLVIAGRKGGVGKTSITAGIASILASRGERTLAIDLDPQANLPFFLGGDTGRDGTSKLLRGLPVEPEALSPHLSVLAGGPTLSSHEVSALESDELQMVLDEQEWQFDHVIFDCPPGSIFLERLAFYAADVALVVTNAHAAGVIGATRVVSDLEQRVTRKRAGPRRWALVTNMLDARRRADREVSALLDDFSCPKFQVRQDARFSEATNAGVPLVDHVKTSRALDDLRVIASWLEDDQ
jgi:chromosome partitioning protein